MPTLTLQPGPTEGQDTDVYEGSPNTNYGTITTLGVRGFSGARNNILLKFDLSTLVGMTITSATLYLYGVGGLDGSGYVRRILPANSGWTEGATWNYADGSAIRWAGDAASNGGSDAGCTQSGVDYSATPMGTISLTVDPVGTENSLVLNATEFAAMVAANHGMVIRDSSGGAVAKQVASSDYTAVTARRPKLVVEYAYAGRVYVQGVESAARPAVAGHVYTYDVSTVVQPAVAGAVRTYNVREV